MKFVRAISVVSSVFLLSGASWAANKTPAQDAQPKPIATVNQQPVSQDAFVFLMNEQLTRGAADSQQLRQVVRNDLIVQTVLSQQALAQRLDQNPQARILLETARRNALVQLWQQDWLQKHPIEKQALEEEYKNVVDRLGSEEFQLRHVLLKDETAARLVLEKVKTGTPLEVLAPEYSSDEQSKSKGGLLGWSSPALMVAGLGDAVKSQAAPKLLEAPIQSAAGWHVVRIEAKRPMQAPSFESLQPQLIRVLAQKELTRAIQALVNQSKIN